MKEPLLFVCVGNTCRSPLAAALARGRFNLLAESAGLRPGTGVASHAVDVAWRYARIDIAGHEPRGLDIVMLDRCGTVVALSSSVAEDIRRGVPGAKVAEWEIPDPFGGSLEAYEGAAELMISKMQTWQGRRYGPG